MQACMITHYLKGMSSSALIQAYNAYGKYAMRLTTVSKVSGVFILATAGIGIGASFIPEKHYKGITKETATIMMLITTLLGVLGIVSCSGKRRTLLLSQECALEILKSRGVTQLPT